MRDFKNKVVVVTGAAGGLGKAICQRFAKAGAQIAATDMIPDQVEALEKELKEAGVPCKGYVLDVTDEDACWKVMESVVKDMGRIDVLVNNAGITHRSAFQETQTAVYRKVMDVNFFGSLYCTKAAIDQLIKNKGAITVISSVAGVSPLLGRTGYSASKHALHGLFGSLRSEMSDKGVDVTIVCPGFTKTNIDKAALDFDGKPTKNPQSTVGKIATPQETAQEVFFATARQKPLAVLSMVGKLSWIIHRLHSPLFERIMTNSVKHELEHD
ncbi:Short chain dehydrogenase/reductase SDR [Desulfatibacillum aliphaticivorans]|uniref:Short chain dehydrogenase/reductase SDR n=1 Tax=Desulfatibacillum aliphaticivorans TaxID=218208 RepID=B8FA03_DESAL|nr:SDR family oxidoreductase [Desulfatibacillum aliphaticivorans]ACL03099.1 Short chain dehydrogenase/reductase SDR [Desulfatibacillum aliphaticivorans]